MATRLYPNTRNPRVLEQLAGVPAHTSKLLPVFDRIEVLAGRIDGLTRNRFDLGYKAFCLRHRFPAVARLKNFLMFGWGRFRAPNWYWEVTKEERYAGSTDSFLEMLKLLRFQEVELPETLSVFDLEGLHWS